MAGSGPVAVTAATLAGALLQDGNIVRLMRAPGKYLRSGVDGIVNSNGFNLVDTTFRLVGGPGNHVRLQSMADERKWLRTPDDGRDLMSNGGGGNQCEWELIDHGKGVVSFKSCIVAGHMGHNDDGTNKPPKDTKTGPHGKWSVEAAVPAASLGLVEGARVRFKNVASGKFVRVHGGSVDATGGDGAKPWFVVRSGPGSAVRFESETEPGHFLKVKADGTMMGDGKGGPLTAFEVFYQAATGYVLLSPKSCGGLLGFTKEGKAHPAGQSGAGIRGQFLMQTAFAPALFGIANGSIMRFKSLASGKHLRINKDKSVDASGGNGETPWVKVHVVDKGIKLESIQTPGAYLKITKDGLHLKGDGAGGPQCVMEVVNLGDGKVALRAHKGIGHAGFTPAGAAVAPKDVPLSLESGFTFETR